MASNGYNAYNYPYQQSSAQQYPSYQTASNNGAQPTPQYQQPSTTQANEYMGYPTSSYSGHSGTYGVVQDGTWKNNTNHSGTRETTNRAAEVLRNMSNTSYTASSTSANNLPGFTSTSAASVYPNRYASNSRSPQVQAQQLHTAQAAYGQSQSRPRSVNTNQAAKSHGLTSPSTVTGRRPQRTQSLLNQQQRSASPAQPHFDAAPPMPSVSNVDSYNTPSATTVDPMAVYDPWPEYQRKQEELRAQKVIKDAARAEEERKAEESRKEEEWKRREQQQRQEDEERSRQANTNQDPTVQQPTTANESPAVPETPLEAEIRAMMAKMRELNSKDPALLARIWEEERRAKAPKSPIVQKSAPQVRTTEFVTASSAHATPVANSRKKTAPRASLPAEPKAATPTPVQLVQTKLQTQGGTRPSGRTQWPRDKRAQLAKAAVDFIRIQNPHHTVSAEQILSILEEDPSYLGLCEILEQMDLKLDRAAFAKNLMTAVPNINASSRKAAAPLTAIVAVPRAPAPAAVLKGNAGIPATPATPNTQYAPGAPSPFPSSHTPAPVAEMVAIKQELKAPANKEEAARKRNLSELVDLTLLSDEDEIGPPPKKTNANASYPSALQDTAGTIEPPTVTNFPTARVAAPPPPIAAPVAVPPPPSELRHKTYVQPLEKKKALRRNNYNPATIARDVLLACGRHPTERQLNQHFDVLRTTLPQIGFESDLSTIEWDLIDPGNPPPGYFKDSVQALFEHADDDDSDEDRDERAKSHLIGGGSTTETRVQPLPEATNPFKQKRRGRPARPSLPGDLTPSTPKRSPSTASMNASASASASVPRSAPGGGVGYRAFAAATEYGADGQPLPKKRGRPKGWRKAIHGSAASQARPNANGHTGPVSKHQPSQSSGFKQPQTNGQEPILIASRSPSVMFPHYQSYKCKWQNCAAELHNFETLQKHLFKVHCNATSHNTLECLWDDCGRPAAGYDPMTGMMLERHAPHSFGLESKWRAHVQQAHLDPLSWKLGDGPASGLSDAFDSEAYLSDAQGRQVTPRIVVDPDRLEAIMSPQQKIGQRGRGRPPKTTPEQDARDAYDRLVAQKRIGGPGLDRGGATLVTDKRRRGLLDNGEAEEELVDADE